VIGSVSFCGERPSGLGNGFLGHHHFRICAVHHRLDTSSWAETGMANDLSKSLIQNQIPSYMMRQSENALRADWTAPLELSFGLMHLAPIQNLA
jgi:hypothetical protein